LSATLCAAVLAIALPVGAAEVVGEAPDGAVGNMTGLWAGVLIGGAAGGPLGALGGAVVGALGGGELQSRSGLAGTAYLVREDDGSETLVRSPNRRWQAGDRVEIVANRLVAADAAASR
jgi:outer membrane lipoprotein SlyB